MESELNTFLAVPCSNPTVANGSSTVTSFTKPPTNDGFFFEWTILEFECDPGYTLVGSWIPDLNISFCFPNGVWFPPIPSCILQGKFVFFIQITILLLKILYSNRHSSRLTLIIKVCKLISLFFRNLELGMLNWIFGHLF